MIILDYEEDQQPIVKSPAPVHPHPRHLVRSTTPTSSLPDYETSEAQEKLERWKHSKRFRFWRATMYGLIVYFILTVAIGVPLLVTKLRPSTYSPPPDDNYSPSAWDDKKFNTANLGTGVDTPDILLDTATACNSWHTVDRSDSGLLYSELEYSIPLNGSLYLRSNISYSADDPAVKVISGSLKVDFNPDPNATDALVSVSMGYSDEDIRNRTSVCLMSSCGSNGLFIYVPDHLTHPDILTFNLSMLLPQKRRHIPSFLTILPLFTQEFGSLSPRLSFGQVAIGGPMSSVTAGSIEGESIIVKSSLAPIRGKFNTSQTLVLDTISAPIHAHVTLRNYNDTPTCLRANTGNGPLDVNVTVFTRSSTNQFFIDAETFNAPLSLSVKHSTSSVPALVHLRVQNNLGPAEVSLDNNFQGTFLASTTFSEATVDSDASEGKKRGPMGMLPVAALGKDVDDNYTQARTIEYDTMSNSIISGWVGVGPRPPSAAAAGAWGGWSRPLQNLGYVEVTSSLNPVLLQLGQ